MLLKIQLTPFILLIAGLLIADQLYLRATQVIKTKNLWISFFAIVLVVLAALIANHTWQNYLMQIHTPLERQLSLNLTTIMQSLSPTTATSLERLIFHNYIHALLKPIGFMLLMLGLASIVFTKLKSQQVRYEIVISQSILLIGFLGYLFGLLLMYLYTFGSYEGPNLASLDRYVGIYQIIWLLVFFNYLYLLFRNIDGKLLNRVEIFIIILIIIGFSVGLYQREKNHNTPSMQLQSVKSLRQPLNLIANRVRQLLPVHAKLYIDWQAGQGFERAILLYELTPVRSNDSCFSVGEPYDSGDVWTCNLSVTDFRKQLQGYDYFLLAHSDQNFWSHYGALFTVPSKEIKPIEIEPIISYQVCTTGGFNGSSSPGCMLATQQAYLFKIIPIRGQVYLTEIRQ